MGAVPCRRPTRARPDRRLGRHRDHHDVLRGLHQRPGGAPGRRRRLAPLPASPDPVPEHRRSCLPAASPSRSGAARLARRRPGRQSRADLVLPPDALRWAAGHARPGTPVPRRAGHRLAGAGGQGLSSPPAPAARSSTCSPCCTRCTCWAAWPPSARYAGAAAAHDRGAARAAPSAASRCTGTSWMCCGCICSWSSLSRL